MASAAAAAGTARKHLLGTRAVVRGLYRDLVHAARLLEPPAQRTEVLQQIRSSFNQHRDLDPTTGTITSGSAHCGQGPSTPDGTCKLN